MEDSLIAKYGRQGKDVDGILSNINRGIDPRKLGKYQDELEYAQQLIQELGL